MNENNTIIVAKILKPHGINGLVSILPYSDQLKRFKSLSKCYLTDEDKSITDTIMVEHADIRANRVFLKLKNIDSREAALKLKGLYLSIDRSKAVTLPKDQWFVTDLIDCSVYDSKYGYLGLVTFVQQNTRQDVLHIREDNFADILLPMVREFIQSVDIKAKRIDVNLPDGLYEIYRAD